MIYDANGLNAFNSTIKVPVDQFGGVCNVIVFDNGTKTNCSLAVFTSWLELPCTWFLEVHTGVEEENISDDNSILPPEFTFGPVYILHLNKHSYLFTGLPSRYSLKSNVTGSTKLERFKNFSGTNITFLATQLPSFIQSKLKGSILQLSIPP